MMSTISEGQGGAHKRENVGLASGKTLSMRIPSFISITVVGEGGKPRADLETSDVAGD